MWHGTACLWGMYVLYCEAGTAEVPGWPRLHMELPDGRWYAAVDTPAILIASANSRRLELLSTVFHLLCNSPRCLIVIITSVSCLQVLDGF